AWATTGNDRNYAPATLCGQRNLPFGERCGIEPQAARRRAFARTRADEERGFGQTVHGAQCPLLKPARRKTARKVGERARADRLRAVVSHTPRAKIQVRELVVADASRAHGVSKIGRAADRDAMP